MAGRLVQHDPAVDSFFDEQEPAAALDDGGYGDVDVGIRVHLTFAPSCRALGVTHYK
jgi:hypothetical protein